MTPKIKITELIDQYCSGSLYGQDKLEFEKEMRQNQQLSEAVQLEKDIQNAVKETDILNLRRKLKKIEKSVPKNNGYFELLEDFTNIDELSLILPPGELLDFYDSLPKAHIYQHKLALNENVHEFYKEQDKAVTEEDFNDQDLEDTELPGLEEAIVEKDIMDLRDSLKKVSELVKLPYSPEEIEKFISGELNQKEMKNFEKELSVNNALKREVEIYREVEKALGELDVIKLRSEVSHLMQTETSWNVSEKDIEDFIDGELKGKSLEEFHSEFEENTDLKYEVSFRKNVNKAIGENDILSLKDKLRQVQKDIELREIKSIVPDKEVKKLHWWKAGVAVAVIFFVVSGLFRNEFITLDKTYEHFYRSPEWSPQRAAVAEQDHFFEANIFFANGEYLEAIELYDMAIKENNEISAFHFYKAASLQNLEKFEEAIPEYSKVIEHGDNMFIEESEWFKSLCLIKVDRREDAKEQLRAIINRKGYYAADARAVLRRIKYSLK